MPGLPSAKSTGLVIDSGSDHGAGHIVASRHPIVSSPDPPHDDPEDPLPLHINNQGTVKIPEHVFRVRLTKRLPTTSAGP